MRPPHFCGGNAASDLAPSTGRQAFNEAPAFLRGKHFDVRDMVIWLHGPSMRPPHFCGGNSVAIRHRSAGVVLPSMRPPHFCGGNPADARIVRIVNRTFNEAPAFLRGKRLRGRELHGADAPFNEAPAFLRGKLPTHRAAHERAARPSMRPPHFCGGNFKTWLQHSSIQPLQ